MLIRALELDDFDGMVALFEAVAAERRFIGTEPGFDQQRYRDGWLAHVEGRGQGTTFVAISGDDIIGNVGAHPHREYGMTLGMMVLASQRGRGIGAALLERIIDWARGEGFPEISLLVFPHNEAALGLYRKFGFEDREYNKHDVTRQSGEIWDTLAMTKKLA